MFTKTRNRILLLNMVIVSAVVIAAFTVIFVIIYTQEHDARRIKLMSGTVQQATLIGAQNRQNGSIHVQPEAEIPTFIEAGSNAPIISGFVRRIEPTEGLSFSLLVDSDGNLVEVNSMVNLPETAYGLAALETAESGRRIAAIKLEDRIWQYAVSDVTVAFQEKDGNTHMVSGEYNNIRFLDVTDSDRMLESLALTLSSLTIVILAAFYFISRFFANRAIRPMEEAFNKQSCFVADASHELKTPLSIINANCGALYANEEETVASQTKWVDSIMRATGRMTGLADNLLSLARIEDKEHELQTVTFDMSQTVAAAVTEIEKAALEKGLAVETNIEPDIQIEIDRGQILKILEILLDNAIKYTDSGGEISVMLQKEKRHVLCAVRNSGEGIPPEDLPRLFDRFYRGDPARSSENEGYGLGLAIAKAAADRLGAELTVTIEPGLYTEFRLRC